MNLNDKVCIATAYDIRTRLDLNAKKKKKWTMVAHKSADKLPITPSILLSHSKICVMKKFDCSIDE